MDTEHRQHRQDRYDAGIPLSFRDRDEGQSLVEFALVVPLLFVVSVGLIDVARAVWEENTLALAAREGTRYAIVHGSLSASPSGPGYSPFTAPDQDTAVNAAVRRYTIGVANAGVKSTWLDGDSNRDSRVSVVVSAPFVPSLSQFLLNGALTVTLRAGSTLAIQR